MIPLLCRIWSGCSGYKAVSLFVALLLFTIFTPFSAQAQSERPKIGLALSGGGALGLAHIGTLKVMEEAGLRPDYITGVSMGSIIGGFYSIGYSADSLYKMFRRADWNLVLSNNIPENKVIFTEKKFFNNSIMSLPITSRKVQLPTGLIRGQQIESLLSYYAWPAADIDDFSNLPIPFLCLGTDLVTCRKVVLKSGYLPDAIRASMAVPSIFTPVKIDTAVLIDGGFVRNIAVSEIKEMGADIIIGSYTGFHRINEEELQSATGVLKQLSFFNSYNDYEEEKKKIDYLIEPVLKGLPVYGFTNTDSIIRRGYKAALPFREKFKKLADSLNSIAPQKPIRNILDKKSYVFDRISVTGNEINSDKQILGVLDVNPHERINKRQLTERIELLYGRAWFEKVKYRIVPKNDSLILMIDCIEKPKALLYGSIHYDNSIRAGLLIGMSARNLISGRSVLDISTFIGQFYRFRSSFTQFVDHNQLFGISAAFNGDYTLLPMMILRNEAGQVKRRLLSTGLSLNERIGLNHMMTISANFENLSLIPDYISASQTKRITYNYLTFNYLNELNTLDSKYFPRRGTQFQISANLSSLLNGSIKTPGNRQTYNEGNPGDFQFKRSYSLVSGLRQYLSASGKLTFMVGGDFLFTYTADSILSPAFTFFLGGQDITTDKSIPMTGFFSNEIPVEKLVRLALDADFAVSDKIHFALLTNIGMAQEPASENQWSLLGGYGLEFGYMSFIGPVRVGIMQGLSSRERYYNSIKGFISLGFNF